MNDKESKGSGSTTAIIIVVAVLLLGLPCLAVVGLFGAGVLFYRAQAVPIMVDSEPTVKSAPPQPVQPVPPAQSAPAESVAPLPPEGK